MPLSHVNLEQIKSNQKMLMVTAMDISHLESLVRKQNVYNFNSARDALVS